MTIPIDKDEIDNLQQIAELNMEAGDWQYTSVFDPSIPVFETTISGLRMDFTKPGSPSDILEHYGVKGMKWGIRDEEETGSDQAKAQKNKTEKNKIKKDLTTGKTTSIKKDETNERGGLSSTQKKALIGVGIGVVAIGGFVAYKHYAGGGIRPQEYDVSGLVKGPISNSPLGALSKRHYAFDLLNPDKLMVNVSRGYADIRHIDGFPNAGTASRHAELIKTLEEMRERYPAVRNMNIEVLPMSQSEVMSMMGAQKVAAAVQAVGPGEARIFYNDMMDNYSPAELAYVKDFQPGQLTKDFLGNHEMGHVLAIANGEIPQSLGMMKAIDNDDFRAVGRYTAAKHKYHKRLFKKHGLSFKELSKLSKYAGTEPAEALAEFSAYFHTPGMKEQMSPELRRKAEAMFNDMGGVR